MLSVGNSLIRNRRSGVTLLEMLIVVSIIAAIASISFPALTAGLAGIRLASAAGSVASYLTSSMNNVERREQPAAILISPKDNLISVFTAASGDKPLTRLEMPAGILIEGDEAQALRAFPRRRLPPHLRHPAQRKRRPALHPHRPRNRRSQHLPHRWRDQE